MRFFRQPGKIKAKPRKVSDDNCDNATERRYLAHLDLQYKGGEVAAYIWKPGSLSLAKGLTYRPDALVVTNDGYLEIHEVKGFWQDTAKAKWKMCKEKFWMIPLVLIKWDAKAKTWAIERDEEDGNNG
jgi:hypothetical protein